MVSSVSRVISTKTFQVSYQRHIKPSFIKLSSRNQKLCSNSSTKMGKNKKVEKIFWVTKWGLQIGARGITNSGSWRYFKSGESNPTKSLWWSFFPKIVNLQLLTFPSMCSKNTSVACKERRNKLSYMIYLNFINFPVLQTLNKLCIIKQEQSKYNQSRLFFMHFCLMFVFHFFAG